MENTQNIVYIHSTHTLAICIKSKGGRYPLEFRNKYKTNIQIENDGNVAMRTRKFGFEVYPP